MNILPLISSLDNSVWNLSPSDFLSFRNKLDSAAKNGLATYSPTATASDDTTIYVRGEILKGSGLSSDDCRYLNVTELDCLDEDLQEGADDDDLPFLFVDFDSPGGTVHAHSTALLIQEIAKTKPVYGYCGGKVCSAAYNLAAMCSKLYLSETAWAGFIGTIFARPDVTEANDQAGVSYTFVASSPKKLYLNPNSVMTEEELAWIDSTVLFYYNIFAKDVLSNRTIPKAFLDSSILIGRQAIDGGMADKIANNRNDLLKNLIQNKNP